MGGSPDVVQPWTCLDDFPDASPQTWIAKCCTGTAHPVGAPGTDAVRQWIALCGPDGLGHAVCHGVCDADLAGPECTRLTGTNRSYSCP